MTRETGAIHLDEHLGGFLPAGHAMVLGMTTAGASLDATLGAIAELLEAEIPRCFSSIMLLDAAGMLRTAAAPSLPLGFVQALAGGIPVGPDVGSCGAAVHARRPVVVEDVTTSPNWLPYATLATDHGLHACWSVPILGEGDRPLGAFAMYYDEPARPSGIEIQRLGGYAQLVAVAVQRDEAKRELARAHGTDALTGLPASTQLPATVKEAVRRCRFDDGEWLAVTTVQVGRLRDCNQALGHAAGDELVRLAAGRLAATVGFDAHLVRTGGSTFTVVVHGASDEDPRGMADLVVRNLLTPFTIQEVPFTADPRAGLAICRDPFVEPEDLIGESMAALERARSPGGSRLVTADEAQRGFALGRLALENDVRRALRDGEMVVHYQPQFRLSSGVLVGVEALVRWQHPQRGLLSPDEFLPAIERGRLHAQLSRVVLDTACGDAARWRAAHPEAPFSVAVNLSAPELHDPRLPHTIQRALHEHGLPGAALCLEITEQAAMVDADRARQTLHQLKAMGLKLAIDDFGTGYSALAHARRFPISYLKIDASFVRDIITDPYDAAVVAAIAGLANGLGLEVIVEGIETADHLQVLRELGCHTGQGYLWSPAVPAAAISDLLATPAPRGAAAAAGTERLDTIHWRPDLDEVLTSIVHEAANPLAALTMHADLLAADHPDSATAETAAAITRQARTLAGILQAARDARELDRGALPLERSLLDMAALVRTAIDDVARTVTVAVDTDLEDGVQVLADGARAQQILTNLIVNAARHGRGRGVRIRLATDDRHAHVTVEDEGPGVPKDKVGLIFRKYGRADTSVSGLGLGLYISRQLARSHGGDLTYRQRSSGGASFCLTLPRHGE